MNAESTLAADSGVVHIKVFDTRELGASLMPFIRNGGLFINQTHLGELRYDLGADVFLVLDIQPSGERITIAGRVIWLSPTGTRRRAGIGVQFTEADGPDIRRRIQALAEAS